MIHGRNYVFFGVRPAVFLLLSLAIVLFVACSFPNMEDPDCAAARVAVRELFSYHFGNDMHFSPEAVAAREKFITRELADRLKNTASGTDPFTQTSAEDPPKAFNLGTCRAVGDAADLDVHLFWKTDTRSEQRELRVRAVKRDGKWLVDEINKK